MGMIRKNGSDKECTKCGKTFTVGRYQDMTKKKLCNDCSPKKELICKECKKPFIFYGITYKRRCDECTSRIRSGWEMSRRAARNPNVRVGVGSGGNQAGVDNNQWNANRIYEGRRPDNEKARKLCNQNWPRKCVLCGSVKRVHTHHIDGNPWHNSIDNIVPLCHNCHRVVHSTALKTSDLDLPIILFAMWPGGRSKIAEKSGEPEMRLQPELSF